MTDLQNLTKGAVYEAGGTAFLSTLGLRKKGKK